MLNPFIRDQTVLFVLIIDFISTWTRENDFTVENDNIIDLVSSRNMPSQWILLGGKETMHGNKIEKEKVGP